MNGHENDRGDSVFRLARNRRRAGTISKALGQADEASLASARAERAFKDFTGQREQADLASAGFSPRQS